MKGNWIRLTRRELLLVLAWALGIFLRLGFLPEQIIADDEWHALNAAVNSNLIGTATHFGVADYCIPLAVYDKLLLETAGISEMSMRMPMVIFGIAGLILLPLLVRPWTGRAGSVFFAWLLAISPIHVYYSRYARPYGISLFLAFAGLIAAYRWWRGGSRRWAVLYVICAGLAPYFHLSVLPVVAAPVIFFGGELLLSRGTRRERSWRDLLVLGSLAGVLLAVLLLPPAIVDYKNIAGKTLSTSSIQWNTVRRALELWSGLVRVDFLLIMGILAFAGGILLARRHPRFLAYLTWVAALQCIVLLVSQPPYVYIPNVMARYAFILVPVGLTLVSTGLGGFEDLFRRALSWIPSGILACPIALTLLFLGPMITEYKGPNNWTNHSYFQYAYHPLLREQYARTDLVSSIPAFYLQLGEKSPGSLRIVEAPWYYEWGNIPFVIYQRFHLQWMAIGFVDSPDHRERTDELPLADPRFRFRNFVSVGDEEGLADRGVDYIVFHRDLKAEIPVATDKDPVDVDEWIERCRSLYGEPVFDDEGIVAFEVRKRSMPSEISRRSRR